MNFEEAKKLDERFVMPTFKRKDVMLVEGKGVEVTDSEGKKYKDFIAGIGAYSLGHCHPSVVRSVQKQAEKLIHVSNYYYIEHRGEVAKMISDMGNECVPKFFSAPWKTFFANSGAEANECAIKLARLYSKKEGHGGQVIITLDNSFHGRTLATLAATAQPAKQEAFAPMPDGFVHVPMNDLGALKQAIVENDGLIAAVMVECIQGESGVHPCDPDYLVDVMKLARQAGFLVIADEVQTGFYRCGTYPFAFQGMGFTPDIFTMAKGIASGFPMGACAARIEVADAFEPGDHGSTFGGSNLAMAAAQATLETLMTESFGERVAKMGAYFVDKLATIESFVSIRGAGLMLAVDLEEDLSAPAVVDAALEAGFLLNATGPHTLRFLPPLTIEKIDIDDLIDAFPGIIEAARVAQAEAVAAAQAEAAGEPESAENKVEEALEAEAALAAEKLIEEDAQAAAEGDETE